MKDETYIYLATPYSHPEKAVETLRFLKACEIAGSLMAAGVIVYSPIAHTHPIAEVCDLPRGWEFWERYDKAMLRGASKVVVAKMDGWQESKGVNAEISLASQMGIPVEYIEA